jgi:hypothetical protein
LRTGEEGFQAGSLKLESHIFDIVFLYEGRLLLLFNLLLSLPASFLDGRSPLDTLDVLSRASGICDLFRRRRAGYKLWPFRGILIR